MSDLVARAEAVLEGVSDSLWEVDPYPNYDPDPYEVDHPESITDEAFENGSYYDVNGSNGWVAHCESLPIAQFIAAARELVPELVAELKAARASEERHLHEIFHLQDDLKAARAEVKLPTERDGARVAPEHLGQLWDCVEDTRQSHRTGPPTERAH